jgi:hypothetical protein
MGDEVSAILYRVRKFAMPGGPVERRGTFLRQVGEMRLAPDRPWLKFTAEQSLTGSGVDFRWEARVQMAPLVRIRVVDAFEDGRGFLAASVLGFIKVARARGPEADVGEAQRGLAELPWRPSAFREGGGLAWASGDPGQLVATFGDGRTQATVEFRVDLDGRVTSAFVARRPRLVGKQVVLSAWSGTFSEYRQFDDLRVPTVAEVSWLLPEGPFTYWRGRVVEFRHL